MSGPDCCITLGRITVLNWAVDVAYSKVIVFSIELYQLSRPNLSCPLSANRPASFRCAMNNVPPWRNDSFGSILRLVSLWIALGNAN